LFILVFVVDFSENSKKLVVCCALNLKVKSFQKIKDELQRF